MAQGMGQDRNSSAFRQNGHASTAHAHVLSVNTRFSWLGLILHLAGPQRQVITQQLHDERAVLVRVLAQGVQVGDRIIERLLCQGAGQVRLVLRNVCWAWGVSEQRPRPRRLSVPSRT